MRAAGFFRLQARPACQLPLVSRRLPRDRQEPLRESARGQEQSCPLNGAQASKQKRERERERRKKERKKEIKKEREDVSKATLTLIINKYFA